MNNEEYYEKLKKLSDKLDCATSEIETLLMKHFREYCVTNKLNRIYNDIISDVDWLCEVILDEYVENGDFE